MLIIRYVHLADAIFLIGKVDKQSHEAGAYHHLAFRACMSSRLKRPYLPKLPHGGS